MTTTADLVGKAEAVARLHAEQHPPADSRGAQDNEGQSFDDVLVAVRPIADAVDVPVSVDLEAGYGQQPDEIIAGRTDLFLHFEHTTAVRDAAIALLQSALTDATRTMLRPWSPQPRPDERST